MVIPCQGKIYMIESANLRRRLKGFRVLNIERSSLTITHLPQADDSLIFCDAEVEQVRHLMLILSLFEAVFTF